MSYSFAVRAPTKAAAKASVAAELAKVVAAQPVHAVDQALAQSTADSFIDLLADASDKDVSVSCHGSVMGGDGELYSVAIGCSAYLVAPGGA